MTRINYHYSCNRWIRLTYSESHWLIDWKIIIGRYAYTRQLKWCNAVDRSLPYNYQLHTFKNSITYTGVHQLKRGTATCERHGSVNNAKIRIGSSFQPELCKQWIWWCQFHWASSGSSSLEVQEREWHFNRTSTIDWSYLGPSITGVDVFYFSPSTQCLKKHPGCQNLTYRY